MKIKPHKIIIEEGELVEFSIERGTRYEIQMKLLIPGDGSGNAESVWAAVQHHVGGFDLSKVNWKKIRKRLAKIAERNAFRGTGT